MQTFKWSSFKLVSCDSQLTQQYHGTLFLCYFEGGNLSGSIYWAMLLRAVFLVHGDWPLRDLEHDTSSSQEPSVNAVSLCWEEWTGFQWDLVATNVFWFNLSQVECAFCFQVLPDSSRSWFCKAALRQEIFWIKRVEMWGKTELLPALLVLSNWWGISRRPDGWGLQD